MSTPGSADLGCHAISRSMLSAYSWSQFGLFTLVLVLLYYLVVGLLYYRQELTRLLTPGKKGLSPQLAGTAAGGPAPPSLVRPTSAFGPAKPAPDSQAEHDESGQPEAGAAENLPTAAEPVVAGELPPSTAGATGQDESTSEAAPMEAMAAASSALEEAQVQDESRTETADQADERLAAMVRREAHPLPSDGEQAHLSIAGPEDETVNPNPLVGGYEPLATFEELEEPVASLLDIITAEPGPQLVTAESVSDYIAQLQAGHNPPMPPALQGSCLAEQMAQHLDQYQAELAALFEADEV